MTEKRKKRPRIKVSVESEVSSEYVFNAASKNAKKQKVFEETSFTAKQNYPQNLKEDNEHLYSLLDYLILNLNLGKPNLQEMIGYIEKHGHQAE